MTLGSRVIVLDEDTNSRRYTERFLRTHGHDVVICADPARFLDRPPEDVPSCVVLELEMASMNGLVVQAEVARRDDQPPLVFTSRTANVAGCIQALKGGAVDCLMKPVDGRQLLDAIARALRQDERERASRAVRQEARVRLRQLSTREQQVCGYLMEGRLNKQIAGELSISESTVKVHRSRAMHKLGLQSVVELVRLMDQAYGEAVLGAQEARNLFALPARYLEPARGADAGSAPPRRLALAL